MRTLGGRQLEMLRLLSKQTKPLQVVGMEKRIAERLADLGLATEKIVYGYSEFTITRAGLAELKVNS